MPDTASSIVTPAATVVIFRHSAQGGAPELLMVQRSRELRFAGGAAVFPGGKVDPADHDLAAELGTASDSDETAARIAAIRETLEETGLMLGLDHPIAAAQAVAARAMVLEQGALGPVLDHFGWTLALDRLVPFARWCPRHDRAFDTRFYLADLGTGAVEVTVDATENIRLFWASAAQALAMADAGEIRVIFPTRRNLERLAQFDHFAAARSHAEAHPPQMISPELADVDGESWLIIPDHAAHGYPVRGQLRTSAMRG